MNLSSLKQKVARLPQEAGVYFFYGKDGELLYIGKATNLRTRVASYFRTDSKLRNQYESTNKDVDNTNLQIEQLERLQHLQHLERSVVPGRSEWIGSMMPLVEEIEFEQTDSVLEALILESNLIKKYQPKYNTLEKDDKSFAYFVITKEEFPRVLIVRKTDLPDAKLRNENESTKGNTLIENYETKTNLRTDAKIQKEEQTNAKRKKENSSKLFGNWKLEIGNFYAYGPYASKQQMQIALKIIRRIFPFHAGKHKTEKGCLDFQLGLCPGPYADAISKEDYKKNIDNIKLILAGKKKSSLAGLEKEMKALAKKNEFEKAAEVRNKIFALEHIRDVALITREMEYKIQETRYNNQKDSSCSGTKKLMPEKLTPARIEAYDISNISGTDAVGSMVVFTNSHPDKSQYRKFKIKTVEGSNDVAMMKEVLLRRFKNDWPMPDLILLDGGTGHTNAIGELVVQLGLDVLVVGVAKGKTRKNLNFQFPISNKIPMTQFPKQLQDFLNDKNLVKSIMDEAHRFAITFHRKLRGKNALRD
jgi:excinuclease ABC subunit C